MRCIKSFIEPIKYEYDLDTLVGGVQREESFFLSRRLRVLNAIPLEHTNPLQALISV